MTTSHERETIWLTQEAYDKKSHELAELRGPVRADIVSRISAARDEGDLKENGGYHAAREELAKLEGRVAQLEQMLEKAEVGQAADDGTISPGFKVSYRFEGDDDVETFLLGAREMADDDIQVFSPQSPLGSALIGARIGKHLQVVIVDAGPYTA
jgi:transcription elongation factor GreA